MRHFKNKQKFAIIATNKNAPVRMCIVCKSRFPQSSLFRYQVKQGEVISFSKIGRSFYLCEPCIDNDQKKVAKVLNNRYNLAPQNKECLSKMLKEIAAYGESSRT